MDNLMVSVCRRPCNTSPPVESTKCNDKLQSPHNPEWVSSSTLTHSPNSAAATTGRCSVKSVSLRSSRYIHAEKGGSPIFTLMRVAF